MRLTVCIISTLCLCFSAGAQINTQGDTAIHKLALTICDCISKGGIEKSENVQDMQRVFLKCVLDSAGSALTNALTSSPGMTQEQAGEEFGKKIALEMFNSGCQSFIDVSMKLAQNGAGTKTDADEPVVKSLDGEIVKVEEKDFLYITVKSGTGRLVNLILLADVDGSARWIKDPSTKLLNKRVSVQWTEEEVYQPKIRDFAIIRELKALKLQQ